MEGLIPAINQIVRFGLEPKVDVPDRESVLEKNLIKIYGFSFEVHYDFDARDFPSFDPEPFRENMRKNIGSNFPDFGLYKRVLDINDLDNSEVCGIGDPVDDLHDIIFDLLQVKWRIENNSMNDGLFFFNDMFRVHIKAHILGLLNYLEERR